MSYIDNLIENCQKAKATKPVREHVIISPFEVSELKLRAIKRAIYIIEQIGGDIKKTRENFSEYRKSKARNCSQDNKRPSHIMYVGSSTTDLEKRISEHMGNRSKGTYALNLDHWFSGEFGGKYKITIQEYEENISRDVLQIIEDSIAHERRPAFGKSGGNNK